mgnify:CR=1 FL=1
MGCFVVCGGGKWWGVALNKSHHVGDNDYSFVARGEMVVCLCCRPHIGDNGICLDVHARDFSRFLCDNKKFFRATLENYMEHTPFVPLVSQGL